MSLLVVVRNPDTNEECQVKLDCSSSIEDIRTLICDRLGVESKHYNLVYKDEIIANQGNLQELDLANDPKPLLYITRIVKSIKPINALSLLGLPGLGSGASRSEEESGTDTSVPHPLPKYTDTGVLEDPTKFSVARNSSFAYRVHTIIKQEYSQEDSEKIVESITTEIQRLVDSLSYDELEQLATECLKINQRRMESLRDQYYGQV